MSNVNRIKELKKELAELEKTVAAFDALDPEQKLAISLHETLCRWNHTDGCSWFYEMHPGNIDNWDGCAHTEYLLKAREIETFCHKNHISSKTAVELISLISVL